MVALTSELQGYEVCNQYYKIIADFLKSNKDLPIFNSFDNPLITCHTNYAKGNADKDVLKAKLLRAFFIPLPLTYYPGAIS